MHASKVFAVSIVAAALFAATSSRTLLPAPEPRDFVLLVMSLAAVALVGRRSK